MRSGESATRRSVRSRVRRLLGAGVVTAVVLGLGLVVCRRTFGWVFPVASGSMEPTVMTGEYVFLRYGRGDFERFDLVVFTAVGGGATVKRVVALPNEQLLIELTGDLRINGELRPDAPGRPPLVPMFDSRLQSIDEHWRHGGTIADPWSLAEGCEPGPDEEWVMDGSAVGRGADLGLLGLHDRIDDGRLLPNGERVSGEHTVHDVEVTFEVFVEDPGGRLRVQVIEQGDVFEASVPVYEGESEPRIDIFRRLPGTPVPEYLAAGTAAVPRGTWIPVRFSNIDNRLTFSIGETTLSVDYELNTPHPTSFDLRPISIGERVRLGGEGVVLRVRNVRVARDFHVVPRGKFGVERVITLGPDEIYVLGDASSSSRDSREIGPIRVDRVLGCTEAVVWPLKDARWLR